MKAVSILLTAFFVNFLGFYMKNIGLRGDLASDDQSAIILITGTCRRLLPPT